MKYIKSCIFSQFIMIALAVFSLTTTVYANDYILTYNCGDGDGVPWTVPVSVADVLTVDDIKNKCHKSGYLLDYWAVSETNDKLYPNTNLQWQYSDDKTLTAQYTPVKYTITYDGNRPSESVTDVIGKTDFSSHTYDVPRQLNSNKYQLLGWVFTGWNTQPDGSGNSYSDMAVIENITTENNATVPLYAQWERGVATCSSGKYLNGATEACKLCESGKVCPGVKNIRTGYGTDIGIYDCPDNSYAVGDGNNVCTCNPSIEVIYGVGYSDQDKISWDDKCTYSFGLSDTGNRCKIENNECKEIECKSDYEMLGGRCYACDRENALTYHTTGNCMVKTCAFGFHPYMQGCYEDEVECVLPNATYSVQIWNHDKMAFGECVAIECEYGYHVENNICQPDVQSCALKNGIGEKTWSEYEQKWGECNVIKCMPGYTSDKLMTSEFWEQCGRCNNMYGISGEIVVSGYIEECEIGACLYQGEKYILENNECRLICADKSDETGVQYWDSYKKQCVHKCNIGYTKW